MNVRMKVYGRITLNGKVLAEEHNEIRLVMAAFATAIINHPMDSSSFSSLELRMSKNPIGATADPALAGIDPSLIQRASAGDCEPVSNLPWDSYEQLVSRPEIANMMALIRSSDVSKYTREEIESILEDFTKPTVVEDIPQNLYNHIYHRFDQLFQSKG